MILEIEHGQSSDMANCYFDVDYVDEHAQRMIGFDKWFGGVATKYGMSHEVPPLDLEDKKKYIVGAATLLNNQEYLGNKITRYQNMEFPRIFDREYCHDLHRYNSCGDDIDIREYNGCVPREILLANLYLIRDMLNNNIDFTGMTIPAPVKQLFLSSGGSVTFSRPVYTSANDENGLTTIRSDPLYSVRKYINKFTKKTQLGVSLVRT